MANPLPAAIFDASPDAVVVVDHDGTIVVANELADSMFRAPNGLQGHSVEELIPGDRQDAHRDHRTKFADNSQRRAMGIGLDLVAQRLDGSTFPADISLSPLEVDGREMTMAAVRDISERRMAERELQAAQERLATMEDRERIARDLHDVVIQEIFGAGLSLQATLGRVDNPEAQAQIESTVEQLDGTIGKLRSVIFDLQHHRRRSSLEVAVEDVVAGSEAQLGFGPRIQILGHSSNQLDPAIVEDLTLTLREALTNIGKHAGASAAEATVRVDNELALVVIDDGVGPGDLSGGGFGLQNMEERATRHGGTFSITERERGGTRLEWRVPLV